MLKEVMTAGRRKELGLDKHQYFGFGERPDPFDYSLDNLRRVSLPTSLKELDDMNLVARMKRSLAHAWIRGYGLAAIQIGIPLRAAWYRIPGDKDWKTNAKEVLLWNPELVEGRGFAAMPNEGCLSIPQKSFVTRRWKKVVVKNGDGTIIEATGIEAFILQHELGHMDGKLCVDFQTPKRMLDIGRNEKCPCDSGAKYKNCCQD